MSTFPLHLVISRTRSRRPWGPAELLWTAAHWGVVSRSPSEQIRHTPCKEIGYTIPRAGQAKGPDGREGPGSLRTHGKPARGREPLAALSGGLSSFRMRVGLAAAVAAACPPWEPVPHAANAVQGMPDLKCMVRSGTAPLATAQHVGRIRVYRHLVWCERFPFRGADVVAMARKG